MSTSRLFKLYARPGVEITKEQREAFSEAIGTFGARPFGAGRTTADLSNKGMPVLTAHFVQGTDESGFLKEIDKHFPADKYQLVTQDIA